ncbi:hypothetical protein SAMD00020551_1966 [Mesobacillus selenatarsenatis SF-1]|uniref:Uncharacterized protein n=1 Tax=Mesobacillus selenatarsenatis (strain DSM 18680 / JCM 14380 / FERM P-15431 / SF-1) TaxID=1321606 RepID=A0A0A8X3J5_MESS1|nr:hypothetical protein SAMD00020551_1966 [Mesobacillus selenatarsenatis SF-1]
MMKQEEDMRNSKPKNARLVPGIQSLLVKLPYLITRLHQR